MSRVELAGPSRWLEAPPEVASAVLVALEHLVARAVPAARPGRARYAWRFAGRPWATPPTVRRERPGLHRLH